MGSWNLIASSLLCCDKAVNVVMEFCNGLGEAGTYLSLIKDYLAKRRYI